MVGAGEGSQHVKRIGVVVALAAFVAVLIAGSLTAAATSQSPLAVGYLNATCCLLRAMRTPIAVES